MCAVHGVQRCEQAAVFIIPPSPWCYYFCAMMQAAAFIPEVGKKTRRTHCKANGSTCAMDGGGPTAVMVTNLCSELTLL